MGANVRYDIALESGDTVFIHHADGTMTEVTPRETLDHGDLTGLLDDDHPQYLLRSGGTMLGELVLSGDPVLALGAATRQYADSVLAQAGTVPKVTVSSTPPSIAKAGDIWCQQ